MLWSHKVPIMDFLALAILVAEDKFYLKRASQHAKIVHY